MTGVGLIPTLLAMGKMPRHVLIELTKVFVFSLVVVTGLFEVGILVKQLLKEGLPLLQIASLLPYILPEALRYAVPVTLLLATTTIYSRMSGANEVVALKALGISPMAILWPALILAFLVSLATVWLNDVAVSWGRQGMKRVVVDAMEEIAYSMLHKERCYRSPYFTINVKRVEDRTLIQPVVTINPRGNAPTITLDAESAVLEVDRRENVLQIEAVHGAIEVEGRGRVYFSTYKYEMPLGDYGTEGDSGGRPANLPLWRIPDETVRQRQAIERHREHLAAAAAEQLLTGEFNRLGGTEWARRTAEGRVMQTRLCELRLEPFRRWAAGFSCLCFVWVGAPMAIWLRNRDFLTSFFLCFAPILIVYYPLLAYGISGAKNGTIPPYSVWAGNLLLVAWGTWLLRKVLRY